MTGQEGRCGVAELPSAVMDPWCIVPVLGGDGVLFGFARRHPRLGGLIWARSSPIVLLDEAGTLAVTASGRCYALGRQIERSQIPREGEEAWLAYNLLLGAHIADDVTVLPLSADPLGDRAWIIACKMARHLGIAPPARVGQDIGAFLAAHLVTYQKVRAGTRGGSQ